MAIRLLVLQHSPWEGPGVILRRVAKACRVALKIVRVWEEPLPDWRRYSGLLVLGGGANVDQEDLYPFLRTEKRLIRQVTEADRPVLGFCLGHQLLACALGAKVGPNFCASIGFVQGHLTHDGREHPAFKGLGRTMILFKWHGQTVLEPLPRHLEVLMTSAECQVEALSVPGRPHILGVQFDNHAAAAADVALWLQKDQKWLSSLGDQDVNPARILAQAKRYEAVVAEQFEIFFRQYLALIS